MKKLLAGVLALGISVSAFAVDLSLRMTPGVFIPMGNNYVPGFAANVQADVDLFGFMTAGVEGLVDVNKLNGMQSTLNVFGGGIGVGAYYFPLSRMYIGAGGSFGAYLFNTKIKNETKYAGDLYARGYAELGFRVNPTLTVNAVGGYNAFLINGSKPLATGVFAGVGAKVNVPLGKNASSGFSVTLNQQDAAFPLYMTAYRNLPLGFLTIRNNEGAEVKDVHVAFRAGKYTSSTFESAVIPKIKKYGVEEIPLYADFSTEILRFSENGKILGEVVIDYNFLGKKMQDVYSVVFDVYNRNAFMWADPAALSAFISPDTPEILEFAKYVAGFARNNFRTGINRNLIIAANMAEALRLSDVRYESDNTSPYKDFHNDYEVDSIQYPLQSMNMMNGDVDALCVLFASCLESVGVGTGFIPLDDDIILLVDMAIKTSAANNNFADISGLIIDDDKVYFGLSMKNLGKGFTESRKAAFAAIKEILDDENALLEFYDTHSSWENYSPAVYSGSSGIFERAAQSAIEKAGNKAVDDYINSEIEGVIANARKSGDPNKIGMALVRIGRYTEAKAEFSKLNTTQGMNNLANVYLLEKNFSAAKTQFEKVLAIDPNNKTALKGIEKCAK